MASVVRPDVDEGVYLDGGVVFGCTQLDWFVVGVHGLPDRENAWPKRKRHPFGLPVGSVIVPGGIRDLDYRYRLELGQISRSGVWSLLVLG